CPAGPRRNVDEAAPGAPRPGRPSVDFDEVRRGGVLESAAMASQATLIHALTVSVPACMLFAGALALFSRAKTLPSFLQLLGAGCLVVVVLAHICEALHLFPSME